MRKAYFVRAEHVSLVPGRPGATDPSETGPPTGPTGRSACFFGRASHTINVWFLAFTLFPRSNMARCVTAKITRLARYAPSRPLTTAALEKMVNSTDQW